MIAIGTTSNTFPILRFQESSYRVRNDNIDVQRRKKNGKYFLNDLFMMKWRWSWWWCHRRHCCWWWWWSYCCFRWFYIFVDVMVVFVATKVVSTEKLDEIGAQRVAEASLVPVMLACLMNLCIVPRRNWCGWSLFFEYIGNVPLPRNMFAKLLRWLRLLPVFSLPSLYAIWSFFFHFPVFFFFPSVWCWLFSRRRCRWFGHSRNPLF